MKPQRQDSLSDQLRDLVVIVNENGMCDAADFIISQLNEFAMAREIIEIAERERLNPSPPNEKLRELFRKYPGPPKCGTCGK